MRLHRLDAILIVFILTASARAGALAFHLPPIPGEITGQVRFADSRVPAEHILVRLEAFSGGFIAQTQTDRSGKFRFPGLALSVYLVVIRHPGFIEVRQQVDLQTSPSANLLIQLLPEKRDEPRAAGTTTELFDAAIPAEARREFEKGREALMQHGKVKKGIGHLEKAVSLDPDFVEAQLLLGTALMDAQQWEQAERALRRVLEIRPRTAPALFALGAVYLHQTHYREAEKTLQEGLQIEPDSWQGHFTLGRVYYATGDLAKAGPQAGRAIQLQPDFADAHLLAGNILLRARRPENALPMFEAYLRLAPKGAFAAQTREVVAKIKRALAEKKR